MGGLWGLLVGAQIERNMEAGEGWNKVIEMFLAEYCSIEANLKVE